MHQIVPVKELNPGPAPVLLFFNFILKTGNIQARNKKIRSRNFRIPVKQFQNSCKTDLIMSNKLIDKIDKIIMMNN